MSVDEQEIRADFKKFKGCNVSIVTGEVSSIFVVECDTKAGHDVDGAANLAEWEKTNGELPPTLMSESPTGSCASYLQTSRQKGLEFKQQHRTRCRLQRRWRNAVVSPPSVRPTNLTSPVVPIAGSMKAIPLPTRRKRCLIFPG